MIKKLFFLLMLVLPMGISAQNLKFGHVYLSEIIVLMPEYNSAKAEMEKLQKAYIDEIQNAEQEMQRKYTEYMSQRDSLPQSIQQRREKEIQDMAQRGEEYKAEAEQVLAKKQQELTEPIFKKANDALKQVGTEKGFTYIFDLSQTPIPYVNEQQSIDVTADVKAKLGIK